MPTLINKLTKKDYLRRICGVKHEKFEKITKQLKPVWRAVQKRKLVEGRPYGVGGLREHLLLLLISDVHDAFVFGANFSCGRSDDLPSNQAGWAASRADFEDKTGAFIERRKFEITDCRRD